ncbi:MAG TPA: NADH-quinone oxidoreductase subunit M, partial [Ktedonobacterales bacterium]
MLLLETGVVGVFSALDLFLFFMFWEIMLVPMYLIIGVWGGERRLYASIKFVVYTMAGSLLMLVAIVVVGNIASSGDGAITLDLQGLIQSTVPGQAHFWLFLAFGAAFAVKSGLFPLHSWAPDAYAEAPIPVAMMLAGVMAKTGTYGFIRFCLPLFPSAVRQLAPLLATLSVIGILFFALQALIATDFRRMLAYVSLSHMGVIVLGIFALNTQGIEGAILQMVNHGILIAALFFIAGILEDRTGSRSLRDYGALATKVPWLATAFMIVSLATLGLPGMNSFAGEFLAFLGAFRFNPWTGLLATFVVVPAAWYMLRFVQGAMQGPAPMSGPVAAALEAKGAGGGIRDLAWHESLILLPVIVLIFGLGLAPGTVTGRIEPSVTLVSSPYAPVTASRVQSGHLGTHVGSHA